MSKAISQNSRVHNSLYFTDHLLFGCSLRKACQFLVAGGGEVKASHQIFDEMRITQKSCRNRKIHVRGTQKWHMRIKLSGQISLWPLTCGTHQLAWYFTCFCSKSHIGWKDIAKIHQILVNEVYNTFRHVSEHNQKLLGFWFFFDFSKKYLRKKNSPKKPWFLQLFWKFSFAVSPEKSVKWAKFFLIVRGCLLRYLKTCVTILVLS